MAKRRITSEEESHLNGGLGPLRYADYYVEEEEEQTDSNDAT